MTNIMSSNNLNLTNPIIISTIPPSLRGNRYSLDDSSYQHQIIRTWTSISRQIVSINTGEELRRYPEHHAALLGNSIEVLTVPSSLVRGYSHLASVKESLLLISENYPNQTVALINADIEITDPSMLRSLQLLGSNQSLISHRNDVESSDDNAPQSAPYLGGFDFFVCNSRLFAAAASLLPSTLTFALPWWDLYLALALSICSDKLFLGDHTLLKHIIHTDRWDLQSWLSVGHSARREFAQTVHQNKSLIDSNGIKKIVNLMKRDLGVRLTKNHLKRRFKSLMKQRKWCPISLHEISDEIILHIRKSSVSL